jgi:NitT/TauT family transport system substrate-binding protein
VTETIRVVNMSREVYYAPQMVAIDAGFFEDEGLQVEVQVVDTSQVPLEVAGGRADFALCGMWQPWLYVERLGIPFTVFAELNQQVPLLLFSRVVEAEFDWGSLEGSTVIQTDLSACSPWTAVQGLLRAQHVDLGRVGMLAGFPPEEALTLFKAGLGEVAEVFAGLSAPPWLADKDVHQLVDWERDLGRIPWSVYFTTPERLEALRAQAVGFTRALGRAQQWLRAHSAEDAAALLGHRFPDAKPGDLALLIGAFLARDQWPASPHMETEAVERWRGILGDVGLLSPGLPFEEIVDVEIATAAVGG